MLSTGIPELQKAEDINWLRECLVLECTKEQVRDPSTATPALSAPPPAPTHSVPHVAPLALP
jgi:hypothetical protein